MLKAERPGAGAWAWHGGSGRCGVSVKAGAALVRGTRAGQADGRVVGTERAARYWGCVRKRMHGPALTAKAEGGRGESVLVLG